MAEKKKKKAFASNGQLYPSGMNWTPTSTSKPSRPQSPTSLGAPYTSTRWGDTVGSVNSGASPATAWESLAQRLLDAVNGGSPEIVSNQNPMTDLFNQVNAGTASGGVTNNGGVAGTTTDRANTVTSPTAGGDVLGTGGYSTYQDRFGGSTGNYTDQYTPAGLNEMNQSGNYDVLVADMLAEMGITNPELIKQLSSQAGFGALIDLLAGGDPSSGASVGFIGDYINQMMTPGGAVPTFDELTSMLLGDTGTAAAGSIQANAGVNDINNYIMDLLDSVGGNQYYQRAMYGALDANQRAYNADRYKGNEQGTYAEMLRSRGLYG